MVAITTNEALTEVIAEVGLEFNYTEAVGEFIAHRDFKVRWRRTYQWISFEVSDYIKGADRSIVESLIRTLFNKIANSNPEGVRYEDVINDNFLSDKYAREHQALYLDRNYIKASDDARAVYEQLEREGIAPTIQHLCVAMVGGTKRYGMSAMFRTIRVPMGADLESDECRACMAVSGQYIEYVRRNGLDSACPDAIDDHFIQTLKDHNLYDAYERAIGKGLI